MRLNHIQREFESLNSKLQRQLTGVANHHLFYDLAAIYNDKDSNGKVIPDNDESDETDDSGKPIPNPMPDDLDEPLHLKPLHLKPLHRKPLHRKLLHFKRHFAHDFRQY